VRERLAREVEQLVAGLARETTQREALERGDDVALPQAGVRGDVVA